MAKAVLNSSICSISGKLGDFVFYQNGSTQCVRRYVVPFNHDTKNQRDRRSLFRSAVKAWQVSPDSVKKQWQQMALPGKSNGYNYFISEYMKSNECTVSGRIERSSIDAGNQLSHQCLKITDIFATGVLKYKATPFILQYSFNDDFMLKKAVYNIRKKTKFP